MFDHLFDTIEQRICWIALYAELLRRIWPKLFLNEAVSISEQILIQDEQIKSIRFTLWELERYTISKLLELEVERRGNNTNPLQYIIKEDDYILFGFNYNGVETFTVSNITSMDNEQVICHFIYGYRALSEYIKKTDIIGIALSTATGTGTRIEGLSGHYRIFNQYKLEQIQKRYETREF